VTWHVYASPSTKMNRLAEMPAAATGWKERWKVQNRMSERFWSNIARETEKEMLDVVKRKSRPN